MSPEQVRTVAGTMCEKGNAEWNNFVSFDEALLTPEMQTAIEEVRRSVCGEI